MIVTGLATDCWVRPGNSWVRPGNSYLEVCSIILFYGTFIILCNNILKSKEVRKTMHSEN